MLHPDGFLDDDNTQRSRRHLSLARLKRGGFKVTGQLTDEAGLKVEKLLHSLATPSPKMVMAKITGQSITACTTLCTKSRMHGSTLANYQSITAWRPRSTSPSVLRRSKVDTAADGRAPATISVSRRYENSPHEPRSSLSS